MAEKKFLDAVGLSHVWNKIKTLYLPLSGGKMTATKAMTRDVNTSFLGLHGGTGENNDGAQLFLCGANHPDMPSGFQLHARNSTTDKILEGFTDGILKWNEKYVLSNAFSMPANTSGINLNSGTDYESGAYVRLYGKENTENAGNFVVAASDGSNLRKLEGNIDGSLKWNGNDVITAAGGTLNGNLVRNGLLATSSATGQSIWLTAGGGTTTGAGAWLYGSTASDKGQFKLRAHDGTNYKDLIGKPDGTLTWAGQSVQNPVGTVVAMGGTSVPSGYLACDGSAVSRTTYAALFAAIGTKYGSGNGSTTFNLPNLNNGSFLEGSNTAGTVKSAGLPNITGQITTAVRGDWTAGTSLYISNYGSMQYNQDGSVGDHTSSFTKLYDASVAFDASRSNAIYGNSNTVQPKSVTVKFCIKY